ncbi:MAG: response regulator [Desulfoprunum sp.]|jgi:two-component system KDP operon response regulator KdpE|uniref:response regulator n=1 Tax=Desulfoprunum sp. TaxID=2020866 RepID=UPI00052B74D1|nr:Fis family transcriptional regulator [Desulfobulbus sp. Tol-SR]
MPQQTHLPRLLIVDDEQAIRRFLTTALEGGEFSLYQAADGRAALAAAVAVKPDIILLDLGLPDMDGVEIIGRIRQWSQVPIIVLSVRDRETDKVKALDSGADDYLTKPFGMGELLARIRATLRRSLPQDSEPVYRINELEVDLARRLVLLRGEEISLTPTEYDLLRLFVTNAGKVLTHRQILTQIWGVIYLEQPHILRVNISNLRHKLEKDASRPRYILTETGVGYRFAAP